MCNKKVLKKLNYDEQQNECIIFFFNKNKMIKNNCDSFTIKFFFNIFLYKI